MHTFFSFIRLSVFAGLLWVVLAMGSCAPVRTILQQAELSPANIHSRKMLAPTAEDFEEFQTAILGPFIPAETFDLKSDDVLTRTWVDDRATVERRIYSVSHGELMQDFEIILVSPNALPDAPVIVTQNFSNNRSVMTWKGGSPLSGKSASFGPIGPIFRYFFGRYIVSPPWEEILDRGYAVAVMHPSDYVPDNAKTGVQTLEVMFPQRRDTRPGTLNVWASLTTAFAKRLKAENPDRSIVAYGHSRYGKTALIAAAVSDNVDAAIAHQSGTAGASLMRDNTGESLKDVVNAYPHWLALGATDHAETPRSLPVDSPALLAAIAPKPIFLGNARRDVWSDPEGAFRAAKIAALAWGEKSFQAGRLDDFRPGDDIAFWTRPGTHGVVKEDWPAFLAFLDAHFKD